MIPGRMEIVTKANGLRDYHSLLPRPWNLTHARRLRTIDVVSNVCASMVDVHLDFLMPVRFDVTESEEDSTIYRRCYDCKVNVPYQVSRNQSCHGSCQFCGVNRRHISCMEVQPDRKSAEDVPVRWRMWCSAYHVMVSADPS